MNSTTETPADLAAACEVAERMAQDAVLMFRYVKEYAAVLAPADPLAVALKTLALQAGAACQAIGRIANARRNLAETPAAE